MPHPTALIAQGLDSRESDEPRALGYLQRLNLAGYDVKGQLSSAYGQSGVGLSVGAKVDFGALLVPFVHLDFGLDVEGERTAHGVLVLQRMPSRVWLDDMVQPPQPPKKDPEAPPPPFPTPYWTANRPLALAFLTGKTWRLKATAVADAWAGLGSLGDYDETGLTLGAKVQGEAAGVLTRLVDTAPRHYPPTPSDSSLNDDVDDLFEDNLKAKAAAWLIETGGGVEDLHNLGAPRTPLVQRAELDAIGEKIESVTLQALDAYDKLAIPDVDSVAITETGFSVVKAMAGAAKKIIRTVKAKKLVTDDLLHELKDVKRELKSWVEYLSKPRESGVLGGETRRRMWGIARLRLAEAEDLIAALERRQDRKAKRRSTPVPRPSPEIKAPPFHLDMTVVEGSCDATSSGKVVLYKEWGAHVEAGAKAQARRISFRYQSFVPGHGDRRLLCSQQTVINYVTRKVSFEASAGKRNFLKQRPNLVTMSYRSVIANWFDDLLPDNQTTIPNGSGVSFGMSILAESFGDYARACKMMKKPPPGQPLLAELPDQYKALEGALTKQLRVTPEELRAFMRNAPSSMGGVKLEYKPDEDPDQVAGAESYLIESAFALTAPLDLTTSIENHRPKALFDLGPVKKLVEKSDRGSVLRLHVIRLRFRVRSDDDKSRNLIRLGWNPEPWGDEGFSEPPFVGGGDKSQPWYVRLTGIDPKLPDWLKLSALALELGIGIERVRRVGSEGIVELYHRLYPHPYSHEDPPKGYGRDRAKQLEAQTHRSITDMLVPPVALFSQ